MPLNKKQFALNAASGWMAQLTFALVGFILLPYIIMRLGEQGYGIYQLARSALVFFMFLQLGMGPTLIRFFAKAIAKNDTTELQRINSTAQCLLGGLGLLASLLGLALIPIFVRFYEIPPDFAYDTTGLLICMVISLFMNMTVIVPQGLVFAANRYDLANCIEISSHLIRLVLIVALFELLYPSILFVGLSILVSQLFRFLALFGIAVTHVGKSAFISIHHVSKSSLRKVLGFSMLNLTNSVAGAVVFQSPILIIGKVLGQEMVAAFAPALLVSTAMKGFLGQTTRPLVPLASQDREQNTGKALGRWAVYAGQLAAFVGFGIALPLATFGPEIMRLWLGSDLAWVWSVVAVMSTGVAVSQVQAANYFLALGGGQIRPTVYSQVAMAVVVCLGTLVGTAWLGWNIFGVALFIACCIFIRNTFYLAYAYSRQFSYSFAGYLWSVYGLPGIITALCVGGGWLLKIAISSDNIFLLALQGLLVLGAYCLLSWLFLIPKPVKSKISTLILAKIRRMAAPASPSSGL
ncbi:O-antigen/teichoic acid export membrane protein [Desulfosalsimonas propionicica]|uniref:O-antigen/teichoic acid export membrane protein n=1 Tax=Desulfosalsimonas propionicica TaxID=332175 RepID=A0A7W0HJE4_9BACT|nr:lipopolysaccharide biosynthesis protein [Desulfosalsimonas propionicica]MBA2879996.1 O-antigen/teichoic acid export membrane protein [Desulfosalsimonas propionicica]